MPGPMSDIPEAFAWPDVPRIAFGPRGDHLDALVGWVLAQPERMDGHIEGFRRAACAVFDSVADRGGSPEYVVFPLAFLWRHHIELSLKEVIALGRVLGGAGWGYPSGHGLVNLWREALTYIAPLGPADAPELCNAETTIEEFATVDPAADGFRYPTQRSGSRSLADGPETINLAQLNEAMDALSRFLGGVRAELSARIELQGDIRAAFY